MTYMGHLIFATRADSWFYAELDWVIFIESGFDTNHFFSLLNLKPFSRGPCGLVAIVLNCDISVSKIKFQLNYYNHFRINIFGKGMNHLIAPALN